METIRRRFRAAVLMGAAASVMIFAAGAKAQGPNSNDNTWPYAMTGRSPVLAVIGDVACQPGETVSGEKQGEVCVTTIEQSQAATANQIENMNPDLIAVVGDEQYQVGQYSDFENSFDLTYGAFKFLQRPAPGNHEFYNEHGAIGVAGYGYFSYYNGFQHNPDGSMMTTTTSNPVTGTFTQPVPRPDGQAGHFDESNGVANGVGDGWYSYNLGAWHLISLNIECETQPGGCDPNGAWFASETQWLANDLAANHFPCTLAYWHQPTFTVADTTPSLEGTTAQAWWELLYQYGADLVLNGHDHTYARYRPVNPSGNYDPHKGIREFIVGTGGETLDQPVTNSNTPNLEMATGDYWGVMALTLDQHGYEWDYESAMKDPGAPSTAPASFSDKGVGTCHGPVNK